MTFEQHIQVYHDIDLMERNEPQDCRSCERSYTEGSDGDNGLCDECYIARLRDEARMRAHA